MKDSILYHRESNPRPSGLYRSASTTAPPRAPAVYSTFCYFLFNVGNVLLCVIYQLNFTVFVYVTRISGYV
jgi:hypothetical protein